MKPSKFQNRVDIYIETGVNETYVEKLSQLFKYFHLEKNLNLKLIDNFQEKFEKFEKKLAKLTVDYQVDEFENAKENTRFIDFTRILNEFNLNFYDKNLKYGNCKLNNW